MIGTNANLKPFPTEYISNGFYATRLIFCVTVAKNASSAIIRPSWTHNLLTIYFLYEVVVFRDIFLSLSEPLYSLLFLLLNIFFF